MCAWASEMRRDRRTGTPALSSSSVEMEVRRRHRRHGGSGLRSVVARRLGGVCCAHLSLAARRGVPCRCPVVRL